VFSDRCRHKLHDSIQFSDLHTDTLSIISRKDSSDSPTSHQLRQAFRIQSGTNFGHRLVPQSSLHSSSTVLWHSRARELTIHPSPLHRFTLLPRSSTPHQQFSGRFLQECGTPVIVPTCAGEDSFSISSTLSRAFHIDNDIHIRQPAPAV
jgi:hypothetical protein